ncbi:MAG: DUF5421 family protein [Chlamydiales bacterium]|nr:DUF5421 family protein [Chlamydiales bacterium]
MSVPPSSQPSSTPPSGSDESREPSDSKKSRKDFDLHGKKKGDEEKKKSLFDIAGGEGEMTKEVKQEIQEKQMAETKEADSISAADAKATVDAIGRLIQRVVSDMRIGQLEGKDFASMNLSTSSEVPEAFAGSNLTLSYEANGLTIHFDNFMTPQQENNAITLVEKNKEQLLDMVQAMQAKNINIQEMSIGNRVINLPRVEPLPPPFQPTEAGATGTRRDRQEQERGGEEGAGPE